MKATDHTPTLFFIAVTGLCIPTNSVEGCNFLIVLPRLVAFKKKMIDTLGL